MVLCVGNNNLPWGNPGPMRRGYLQAYICWARPTISMVHVPLFAGDSPFIPGESRSDSSGVRLNRGRLSRGGPGPYHFGQIQVFFGGDICPNAETPYAYLPAVKERWRLRSKFADGKMSGYKQFYSSEYYVLCMPTIFCNVLYIIQ
jgi:hypothetical protein